MSRKPKAGYWVKGQFVAYGSELDVELSGKTEPSRTDLKKESDERQKLGVELLTLRADLFKKIGLPDKLVEAMAEAKRITNFEGKRRQMQFVGKLMRLLDEDTIARAKQALDEQRNGSAQETLALHQAETWRDKLIASDDTLTDWMAAHPATDAQALRALIRQARKDASSQKDLPGQAPRHGKAYREIFQLVRTTLLGGNAAQEASADEETDTPNNA
jgi:ribosome-associated protein